MKTPIVYLIFFVALLLSRNLFSQDTADYYPGKIVRYEDMVYDENIKTVRLYPSTWELSPPVIILDTDQKLKLSFDDLRGEIEQFNYNLIHCNSEWEPTNISSSEYIEGYSEDVISDYKFSFNTLQKYVHYNLTFPTEVMKLKRSGNYLLNVYYSNDPDKLIITRRFLVTENSVQVDGNAHQASLTRYNKSMQQVDFVITNGTIGINDAYTNTKPVILQNYRWDNAIFGLRPLFMNDNSLTYQYDDKTTFTAGNEYRHFDVRTVRMQTDNVAKITNDSAQYHVWLITDERRSSKRYFYNPDINGAYIIKTQEGRDYETDADYVWVHFALNSPEPFSEGNVYVFGSFSDWQCKPLYRMRYNEEKELYLASVFVKQGYYNYEYAIMKDSGKGADNTLVEGSHYETENNYTILVYFYDIRLNMDRLIGIKNLNTINKE